MRRCDLPPEDCIADHLCLRLDARPGTDGQWTARCPGHRDTHRSLSLRVGSRGQRIVWKCHRGCDPGMVRELMIRSGVPSACIPWRPPRDAAAPRREVEAQIEQIIMSESANPQRMRLLIGMALWDCGRHEAATKLGISRATMYRAVSPVRQTGRSPESHP